MTPAPAPAARERSAGTGEGLKKDAATGGAWTAASMGLMNVATYGYTLICARVLGPQAYGAFSAVLGVLIVVSVAQLGLQATGARRIAAAPGEVAVVERAILGVTARLGFALGAVLLVAAPFIDRGLRLESLPTALLVGLSAIPIAFMGGLSGVLQGERRWRQLGYFYIASGVPRLVIGTGLVLWRPEEFWAIAAVLLGFVPPVLVGWWVLRERRQADHDEVRRVRRGLLGETLHNSHALLAFFAVCNVDIVVARNVLTGREAGLYAGGLILVKTVLFLPQFVAVIAFPSMASDPRRRRALLLSCGATLLLGLVVVAGTLVLNGLALTFIGGSEYAAIQPDLWRWALLGTLLSTLQLLVYGVVARQSRWTVALLWAGLAGVLVAAATASTVTGMVTAVTAVDLVLVAVLLGVSLWHTRPSSRETPATASTSVTPPA